MNVTRQLVGIATVARISGHLQMAMALRAAAREAPPGPDRLEAVEAARAELASMRALLPSLRTALEEEADADAEMVSRIAAAIGAEESGVDGLMAGVVAMVTEGTALVDELAAELVGANPEVLVNVGGAAGQG